jgi:proteasome accessory factor C
MEEPEGRRRSNGRGDSPIRPERFARLVTLAGILVEAAQKGERLRVDDLRQRLKLTRDELREDIDVLNVVNFGGGTYVLYAEVQGDEIEVDSQPYGDSFARPARLLPLEAKALVAAMDLIGVQMIPGLERARRRVVKALGHDPTDEGLEIAQTGDGGAEAAQLINRAIDERKVLRLHYYKPNEDEFTKRTIEPYVLQNGKEGWYVASYDQKQEGVRHFKLDRIREIEETGESFEVREEILPLLGLQSWMKHGEMEAAEDVARVWISPEEARRQREERTVLEELADGSIVVAFPYQSTPYLVTAILSGAGDYVVLEPEYAREAVAKELK